MPRMKMTAMKQPISNVTKRIILPAPKAATKSVPSGTGPRHILPAPGFKAKTILPAAKSSSPHKTIKPSKAGSNRLKLVKNRITVKRDIVSRRFIRFSIPKVRFQKLVRDIAFEFLPDCKFQTEALYALQTACEDFLAGFFHDANLCTLHAKRVTLMDKDTRLVKMLRRMDLQME
mmetsp:Transcript_40705/g.47331  ORF Transcript_40705/g.47331 Transcript_40705/m.47331 type:complete len:175 (-) Transcript_40705:1-525(-)